METSTPNAAGTSDRTRRPLGGDIDHLRDVAQQRTGEIISTGRQWVLEHPLPAVAAAFAVGYVLAGGLVSKTTLRLARTGLRIYTRRFLSDMLGRSAQELFSGMGMAEPDDAGR